jgi:hypothetical protein
VFAPKHYPESTSGWLIKPAAVATLDQIRYAEALRLQIREAYLGRRDPPPSVWMIGVD